MHACTVVVETRLIGNQQILSVFCGFKFKRPYSFYGAAKSLLRIP